MKDKDKENIFAFGENKVDKNPVLMDVTKAIDLVEKLSKSGSSEISYGAVAFWIAVIKKCENIPDDISMSDFFAILNKNAGKYATVAVREGLGER